MLSLPPELFDQIILHLHRQDIFNLRLTCRYVAQSVLLPIVEKIIDLANVDHDFLASRFATRLECLYLVIAEHPQHFTIPPSVTSIELYTPETSLYLDHADGWEAGNNLRQADWNRHEDWATATVEWLNGKDHELEHLDVWCTSSRITPIATSLKWRISMRDLQVPVFYSGLQALDLEFPGDSDIVYNALLAAKLPLQRLRLSQMLIRPNIRAILPVDVELYMVAVIGSLSDCFDGWVGERVMVEMVEESAGWCVFDDGDLLNGWYGGENFAPATLPAYVISACSPGHAPGDTPRRLS